MHPAQVALLGGVKQGGVASQKVDHILVSLLGGMLSVIDLNAMSSVLSFSLLNSTNNCSITRAISTMELNVRKHVEKNGKQDFSCLAQLSQSNKKSCFEQQNLSHLAFSHSIDFSI